MSVRETYKKITLARESLMVLERKISELPYPANSGVHVHLLELTTNVRMTALEIDQISLRLELIMLDMNRITDELKGIRGMANSILWWRKARALKKLGSLVVRQEALGSLLDGHREMIPLFEDKLSMLD